MVEHPIHHCWLLPQTMRVQYKTISTCLSNVQLSKPQKVPIPERYVESDPDEPVSPEELEERSRRAERIKNLLAKSR